MAGVQISEVSNADRGRSGITASNMMISDPRSVSLLRTRKSAVTEQHYDKPLQPRGQRCRSLSWDATRQAGCQTAHLDLVDRQSLSAASWDARPLRPSEQNCGLGPCASWALIPIKTSSISVAQVLEAVRTSKTSGWFEEITCTGWLVEAHLPTAAWYRIFLLIMVTLCSLGICICFKGNCNV